jgi:hypothetical protein
MHVPTTASCCNSLTGSSMPGTTPGFAHVEDCVPCQDRLERLTAGRPATGDGPPIGTVQTDSDSTVDLPRTEIVERDVGQSRTGGAVRQREPASTWEKSSDVYKAAGPGATADFSHLPAPNRRASYGTDQKSGGMSGPLTRSRGAKPIERAPAGVDFMTPSKRFRLASAETNRPCSAVFSASFPPR